MGDDGVQLHQLPNFVLGLGRDVTGDGRALARDLSLGFEAIQRGVGQLRNDGRQDTVQVTMSPAFAVR